MKIRKDIAHAITYVGQPPIIAMVTFFLLVYMIHPTRFFTLLLITWVFAGIVPMLSIRFLVGDLLSEHLQLDREDRVKPFLAGIISYLIGFLILYRIEGPFIVTGLMVCYIINTIVMASINHVWKISAHASGIAGPVTAIIYYLSPPLAFLLFLLILPVCWSRVTLKAHTSMQVTIGALVTIGLTWVQLSLLSFIL